ncbi:hypothetical protein [Pontibacter vulgaris]|uniref:hypothetical protein n=1 Tax=Pontibacter vulgaris TaxID=2905679 RepID=UPI001FA76F66|nr:hypothetical protein [Pontibacter vulgaris]
MKTFVRFFYPFGFVWSLIIYALIGGAVAILIAGEISVVTIIAGLIIGVFAGAIGGVILEEYSEH